MAQIFRNIFFFGLLITLFTFITIFYFSEENIKNVNKSRSFLPQKIQDNLNLPILNNDTDNVIIYSDEVEIYKKKKKKYNFFDLIKNK